MPSTTRGSILISTANDIGEALVEKLGGVGYSPNEWKEKYNLCGIAPIDSAPALSVLADSAGTGDERGSILIATADAIGAILNKKYNVLRGFKPKEWASACRKMKALEEGSVASASITSFSDGADTVPLTSCVCSIDANLDGKTAVNVENIPSENLMYIADVDFILNSVHYYTENGILYIDGTSTSETSSNNNAFKVLDFWLPSGTYYFSRGETLANLNVPAYLKKYDDKTEVKTNQGSFTLSEKTHLYIGLYVYQKTFSDIKATICINLGTTAISYVDTKTPETKTADLGRAVLCGSANIVTGNGIDNGEKIKLNSLTWSYNDTTYSYGFFDAQYNITDMTGNMNFVCTEYVNRQNSRNALSDGEIGVYNKASSIRRLVIRDDSCATLAAFLAKIADYYLAYESTTDTPFTFEPVKIDSFPGVNNIWNDCGNTAVEYYQAPTPYARKTATGGIANFSDQRTDLPLTKAIANIAPSIAGKSAVNLYQGKKNIYPAIMTQDGANRVILYDNIYLPMGDYYLSLVSNDGVANFYIKTHASMTWSNVGGYNKIAIPITISDNDYYDISYYISTGINAESLSNVQLEVGSSQSAYVPYQAPTTYTAELGETVYGGSVDFVSGEVVKKNSDPLTFNGSENWQADTTRNGAFLLFSTMGTQNFGDGACNMFTTIKSGSGMNSLGICFGINNYAIYIPHLFDGGVSGVSDISSWKTYLQNNDCTIVYPLATPTESEIPGRVISPIEGVNNYWNDAGGDTEIQYFENEA